MKLLLCLSAHISVHVHSEVFSLANNLVLLFFLFFMTHEIGLYNCKSVVNLATVTIYVVSLLSAQLRGWFFHFGAKIKKVCRYRSWNLSLNR